MSINKKTLWKEGLSTVCGNKNLSGLILEHVQDEVMAGVISLRSWIIVFPLAVVDGDLHLRRVPMIEAIGAAIVLVTPKVLWIVNIRIVLETIVISLTSSSSPHAAVGLLWLLCVRAFRCDESDDGTRKRDQKGFADHIPPQVILCQFLVLSNKSLHRLKEQLELNYYSLLPELLGSFLMRMRIRISFSLACDSGLAPRA